ncbi:MAG TPA: helix-turn-helix transcriptional regulator, partial [Anaerolineae bacterium]|nr:helix-turn-helix transcriptional regulator [Anaerolineae bacterium]
MRAKSQARQEAERLRREEGLSYNEIAARTNVSKSTLSHWLRDVPLQPDQVARLQDRLQANRAGFAARAWPVNRERHARARQAAYDAGAVVVTHVPDEPAVHELAFAMLYLGEGSKTHNRVEMASVRPDILRYMLWVLDRLYRVEKNRIICRLHLVAGAQDREETLLAWWVTQLGVARDRFQQTSYDR